MVIDAILVIFAVRFGHRFLSQCDTLRVRKNGQEHYRYSLLVERVRRSSQLLAVAELATAGEAASSYVP